MTAQISSKETPLMRQYYTIKKQHPGTILLFRVGDFYETFCEDACCISQLLDIVLTKRSNGAATSVALAGFPYHALDTYLPKIIQAGHRVAICEQLEDPKLAKGIVKRGVTELITPGLSFHDQVLNKKTNNYLASIFIHKEALGMAFLDISTGEFITTQGPLTSIDKLLKSFRPAEIIGSKSQKKILNALIKEQLSLYYLEDWVYKLDYTQEKLNQHFRSTSLKGFGIAHLPWGIIAAGAILRYLEETKNHYIQHITAISRMEEEKYVWLDQFTINSLELLVAQQEGGIPLIDILNKTVTPMGARLMKKWLVLPLKNIHAIQKRLDIVALYIQNMDLKETVLKALMQMSDIERLISKVAARRANPRDIILLKKALIHIKPIQIHLKNSNYPLFITLGDQLHTCQYIIEQMDKILQDNPPLVINQGKLIKDQVHEELDQLRSIAYAGKDYLVQLQQKESKKTGISSLKVAYNKIYGYFFEVTHAHKDKVPTSWIRKQTLVNAERYITEELKEYEESILQAEEKIYAIEQQLYLELMYGIAEFIPQVQQNAKILAQIDCYIAFAQTAIKNNYIKPQINDGHSIDIKAGRHPVVEQQLTEGGYVANDIYLDSTQQQVMVITGPNMAGKSALLRQTALIVLMAQIGAFVPAAQAHIGIIDKVFTRVGAADNLTKGESTFMVEMTETASIMHNLSARTLILMDEIGRGTSTYDGIAIAWSIVEYLHNHAQYKALTLFATHYHELNQLAEKLSNVHNFHISVKKVKDEILFLRKLEKGSSEHSFGIYVAQMAGMPIEIVQRAEIIMQHLSKDQRFTHQQKNIAKIPVNPYQLTLFEQNPAIKHITTLLQQIDINTLAPVEALLKLNELKNILAKN